MSDSRLILLDLSAYSISTEVIESSLLAYGIEVVRMEVGGHSVYPTGPMTWFDLYVPEERLAEAQAILEKLAETQGAQPNSKDDRQVPFSQDIGPEEEHDQG